MNEANELSADVLVLGSGFGGSLMALVLQRLGLRPLVVDAAAHPRFAVGESSTPAANRVLAELARCYDLPQLLPLAKYGSWRATYPQLVRGLKRGFSYFQHEPGRAFAPRVDHANELLVAASRDDEHGDTHWLRSDVDGFLAEQVCQTGITLLESTRVTELHHAADRDWPWQADAFAADGRRIGLRAKFAIDATGEAGVVLRALGIPRDQNLATNSRTIFTHFWNVRRFDDLIRPHHPTIAEHPFDCDDAAQHHILDGGWMWVLRFDNGLTSVGLVLDGNRWPDEPGRDPRQEWNEHLGRYPSLVEMLRPTNMAAMPGRLIKTPRLQRRAAAVAGRDWAALPHTAGFIDPLHSTGIAHTLCGIERLAEIFSQHWEGPLFKSALGGYQATVLAELSLIDELVAACFRSFGNFRLLTAATMLYFAAATTWEHHRAKLVGDLDQAFLCAEDREFVALVRRLTARLNEVLASGPSDSAVTAFERDLSAALAPFNHVGLCDPAARNLYRHTVAPE